MAKRIARIGLVLVAVVLVIVAFAGVVNNQGQRTNRVIDKVSLERTDKYMTEEVIRTWYGQIGLTNVEEYGTNNSQVSAIIHYANTTDATISLSADDFGIFMDDSYDYTIYGDNLGVHKYEPGDTAEFLVNIKRKDGLEGLTYLIAEPERSGNLASENEVVYQSSIDLNMLTSDIESKKELYGITEAYTEKPYEESVGRNPEHVEVVEVLEELILFTDTDSNAAHAEEMRILQMERDRQDALNYLDTLKRESEFSIEDVEESEEA